jgi:hypothetical protein
MISCLQRTLERPVVVTTPHDASLECTAELSSHTSQLEFKRNVKAHILPLIPCRPAVLDTLYNHEHIHSVYSLTHFPSIANSTSVHHALISVCNALNPDTRAYAVRRGPSITVADPGSIAAAGARRGIDAWVSGEESD